MSEIITKNSEEVLRFMEVINNMVNEFERVVDSYKPSFIGETYLTDKELSERLKISRRTLQEWRNTGKIEYIQLEGKILYAESAIERLLKKHYQEAWAD